MNEFIDLTSGCELRVRKRIANFLEKLMCFLGFKLNHDVFKKIVYSEDMAKSDIEVKIKSYYDAYNYLISNHKNPLTKEILSKFFFILYGKIADASMLLRLSTSFFKYLDMPPLESAIEFHLKAYSEMVEIEKNERLAVSLMFFNYMLLRHDIPTVQFLNKDFEAYKEAQNTYFEGNKKPMFEFVLELIKKAKFQKKEFYDKLTPLTLKEIYDEIKKDEYLLKNKYGVKSVFVFGSFAKGIERIDSDIDMFIAFSLDLTYEKKTKSIAYLSEHYFNVFHRFIDITEVSEYLNDEYIITMTNIKKIF